MELSIDQSMMIWRTILFLYAIGYWCQVDSRRNLTIICCLSCAIGMIVFNNGHHINHYLYDNYQLIIPVTYILYAIADTAVLGIVSRMKAGIIPMMYVVMIMCHSLIVLCDMLAGKFPYLGNFVYIYEPIMIVTHVVVLASLFRGSRGSATINRIINKCWLRGNHPDSANKGNKASLHHNSGFS